MHVVVIYKLRQYFGLDKPGTPVKIIEPYQILGEIKDDLKNVIGIDVTALESKNTFFGFDKENWNYYSR